MLEYLINIMLKILNILKYSLVYTLSLELKKHLKQVGEE